MRTSISTASIPGELTDKLAAISSAGFDGVELFELDFITYPGDPRDAGRLIGDHGLTIDLFQPIRDFEGLTGAERALAFERLERKFDIMQELGADLALVSASCNPNSVGDRSRIVEDFQDLGERAQKRGMRIGFEPLQWSQHTRSTKDAWDIVREVEHPSVGLVLDSFNALLTQTDHEFIAAIPGDRIFHVQVSDAPSIQMDPRYLSRHFRCMPGEGDFDLVGFTRAVIKTGFAGPISIEVTNDEFRGGVPRIIAQDGYRSLLFLLDQVRTSEPLAELELPEMPGRSRIEHVEFVEFTANDKEAAALRRMLQTLGFSHVAQHVSKKVEVWQQGQIRLVINTEKEGFAHSAYVMHGTCVCDIGFRVDDAKKTEMRAVAMGSSIFSQRNGKNEIDIPAVRGVGGSVLHFLDQSPENMSVWTTEFDRFQKERDRSAGLSAIDHIAQTMRADELLTWTLFYTSIFDLGKTPIVDVEDPGGLVRSLALKNSNGKLRLTMNGADTHKTFAGRFIADSFGSLVQHIAFATEDIFSTANTLLENGFQALQVSPNYYLELAARFGLDQSLVADLSAYNLLFDRDENGEFFQLYSKPYGNGFFFEIVERRDGYDGYGASNAAYRTAALKQFSRPLSIPRV